MDPKKHAELVTLRQKNFEPAWEFLLSNGVPILAMFNGRPVVDFSPHVGQLLKALEFPLWPFNQAGIVQLIGNKSARKLSWPILKDLLYKDWTPNYSTDGLSEIEKLARGNVDSILDMIAGSMSVNAGTKRLHELTEMFNDDRLGGERTFFLSPIRRFMGEESRSLLEAACKHPFFSVEAKNQIKLLDKRRLA